MQEITPRGSVFGRIGKSVGQGLADQIPKEVDRYRLSQGLQNLAANSSNSTPLEQYAQAASIPGITPSMLQALPEILKQQNTRQAYRNNSRNRETVERPKSQNFSDVNFANMQPDRKPIDQKEQSFSYKPESYGQPQISENNPLRSEAQPVPQWTPERRDEEVSRLSDIYQNLTIPELVSMAADNEKRDLAQPEAERAKDDYLREVRKQVDEEFQTQLETKLQKKGEEVYKDITGENKQTIKRAIEKELRSNPKATVQDVVDRWTNKALDLAKTKSLIKTLSDRGLFDEIGNPQGTYNKLKNAQKIFKETGNEEEFYNILKTDFGMSPQAAAYVAYDRSKKINEYLNNIKTPKFIETNPSKYINRSDNSRKYAIDIEDLITRGDSLLAISKELRQKDPLFDQRAFFNQLSEDQDQLGLSPRQKRELVQGASDLFPNWGDILILPNSR